MLSRALTIILAVTFLAAAAGADWYPGDGHKMHFPQMPDEAGWNVNASFTHVLADDWQCSESGPVRDIHFWGSWFGGNTGTINGFQVSIYSDIPDPDPGDPATWSEPGDELWSQYFSLNDIVVRHITPIPQVWEGWFDPVLQEWNYPDHDNYFQYNITDISEPFIQTEEDIYWLSIEADIADQIDPQPLWGWKSSTEHWNDNAVYAPQWTRAYCTAPDNGTGTIDWPANCPFASAEEVWMIIDSLPPGTTIELDGPLTELVCDGPSLCSAGNPPGMCEQPGGSLGGTISCFSATLDVDVTGTGELTGFTRHLAIPVEMEVHTGPRNPSYPQQTFPTDMFRLQGEIVGDPDFSLLIITGGTDFGLPSPGVSEITLLPSDDFNVDSFFDITYQIEFEGAPGSQLEGLAGTTTATIHVDQGQAMPGSSWLPMDEPVASQQVTNVFWFDVDPMGVPTGGGENAYGDGWYFYPEFDWWNIWFYDHPLALDRYKEVILVFDIFTTGPGAFAEIAVNWSTDVWSLEGNPPGDRRPPLPGEGPEDLFIGRQTVFGMIEPGGHYEIPFVIDAYNPEWVSIDIRGINYAVPEGIIIHECVAMGQEQLDLAFVITNTSPTTCCLLRGDVDHNGVGPDIGDLVYLVNFMFNGGPLPPCEEPPGGGYFPECDTNGDGTGPDIGDLVYLVNYMFNGGPALIPCP